MFRVVLSKQANNVALDVFRSADVSSDALCLWKLFVEKWWGGGVGGARCKINIQFHLEGIETLALLQETSLPNGPLHFHVSRQCIRLAHFGCLWMPRHQLPVTCQ